MDDHKILPAAPRTQLEDFAKWFGQDWMLIFPNVHEGARRYISRLSPEDRHKLREELEGFITGHTHDTPRELRGAWVSLGAEGWDPDVEFMPALKDFAEMTTYG